MCSHVHMTLYTMYYQLLITEQHVFTCSRDTLYNVLPVTAAAAAADTITTYNFCLTSQFFQTHSEVTLH